VRRASARGPLPLPPAEVLRLWTDVDRWPTFVEGFARRLELTEGWPEPGSRVVWESTPDGRGRVTETVTAREPDRFSTQVYEAALTGVQTLRVLPANGSGEGEGSRGEGHGSRVLGSEVELALEYQLSRYGPLRGVADALFIRRALRDSLRRTLFRFSVEAEEEANLR
jgi:Polyketide cyclase / dehydrase and lipid transport